MTDPTGESPLETALAEVEAASAALLRRTTGLLAELRGAQAAARSGEVRRLQRSLASAAEAATALGAEASRLPTAWTFDVAAHLASGAYTKELLAAAAGAGLAIFEADGRLLCYPSLVAVAPTELAVEIDRKRDRRLRPSAVVRRLADNQQRGSRFKAGQFLAGLARAYDYVVAKQGKQPSAVVRLLDIHEVLTLLPGQRRDYGRQEFARDLYLLDESREQTDPAGRVLHWAASTGTRHAGVLTTVSRGGQPQRYWGISFVPAR